jgi:hypothetical protein
MCLARQNLPPQSFSSFVVVLVLDFLGRGKRTDFQQRSQAGENWLFFSVAISTGHDECPWFADEKRRTILPQFDADR